MLTNQLEKMSSPTMARSCFLTRVQRSWSACTSATAGASPLDTPAGQCTRPIGSCKSAVFNIGLLPETQPSETAEGRCRSVSDGNWKVFRAYAQGGGCAARDRVTMRRPASSPIGRLSTAAEGLWTSAVRQPAGEASNVCSAKVMMHPRPLRLAATDSVSPLRTFLVESAATRTRREKFKGSHRHRHYCAVCECLLPRSVEVLTYYLDSSP